MYLAIGLPSEISESSYPVYWVEAFNEAMQKWVVVDPLVTRTIAKPSRLEPPASDRNNNMTYVIAFEDDASARDVTRRYVKSFNSKTRKSRVEYTKDGENWWERTMKFFERPFLDDRDQLEVGELTAKAAGEGMPRNVQDFKNHPIYALERHLRRNEVIHPKREIGKVGLSKMSVKGKTQPLESVYRRSDVHLVKSADGWYRQGRSIKAGEQPLKRVPVSQTRMRNVTSDDLDSGDEEAAETAMYAEFQTELYQPPPVTDNKVPKNGYGNIDIYAPNMVPAGGFHLRNQNASLAARILGIDYADAVTGFQFKGRHGTAVTQGIVASAEYREALLAVLGGLQDQHEQAEQDRRTLAALSMWKQFLIRLRVAERVSSYKFEGEESDDEREVRAEPADFEGGGFLPKDAEETEAPMVPDTPGAELTTEPTVEDPGFGGGFMVEPEPDSPAVYSPAAPSQRTSQTTTSQTRYNLVVIPKGSLSTTQKPIDTTTQPSTSFPVQQDTAVDHPGLPPSQNQPSQPPSASANTAVSATPSLVARSVSLTAEEASASLPDLVHADSDSEIDQQSMLSHDPEDEDADPEWLLSD